MPACVTSISGARSLVMLIFVLYGVMSLWSHGVRKHTGGLGDYAAVGLQPKSGPLLRILWR